MALKKINLDKWNFAIGEEKECLKNGREVIVPHTWNVEDGTEDFWGIGWYECRFIAEECWERVRILFHAVYHDAEVWLNDKLVGEHKDSGYTPFTLELTDALKKGEKNVLRVKANNAFSATMLPYERSFDWANDGGLIRPVELLITGANLMKEIKVTAKPVITAVKERQSEGCAVFGVSAVLDGNAEGLQLDWELYEGCDGNLTKIASGEGCVGQNTVCVPNQVISDIKFWHFDDPVLYTVKLVLKNGEGIEDCSETVIGFRDFHIHGKQFYLNGEVVRLPGTEWMPGSDPVYGMAETKEQLEKMLLCLKETNSVLTRFHWQQDDWVYDWCDRNGMLVQEEVPFWGRNPEKAGEQQWKNFKQQIEEMVSAHRNHPSIIAWGIGNELDSLCDETILYIKNAVAYTHILDEERTANYVSNHMFDGHSLDATTDGDIMMINDYIGTWHQGYDQYKEWDAITRENPDKPMIPSEFGVCEPAFSGGDERRNQVFLEKMECYRKYPNVAGTVYFCLNDYRTQMGEEGEGKLRRRVHGSTGLCGDPKPSYFTVQKEYNPLILSLADGKLELECKEDIPSYSVAGYYMVCDDAKLEVPFMKPGEKVVLEWNVPVRVEDIQIFRKNGNRVK